MPVKTIWQCVSFGTTVSKEEIYEGEPVQVKLPIGILHEICLLSNLDIPDLED